MSKNGNRVMAITGGSRGIGLAIAELFSERGDHVAISSRSPLEKNFSKAVVHFQLNAKNREDQNKFVSQVVEQFGQIDVFINCAGVSLWRSLEEIDASFASEMIETNILGVLWGCAAASGVMTPGGSIINVSSLAGKRGSKNNSVYCATKFAVNGITQSLAKELGPKGIRVNAVCPVYVNTKGIVSALAESASPAGGTSVESYLTAFASEQTALGRLPSDREVAEVVYFLASPAASAVTGQCMNVDCGTFPQ